MESRNPTKEELDKIRALEKIATNAKVKLNKADAIHNLAQAEVVEAMNELQNNCNVPNNAQLDVLNREKWVIIEPTGDGKTQRQRPLVQEDHGAKVTELKKPN